VLSRQRPADGAKDQTKDGLAGDPARCLASESLLLSIRLNRFRRPGQRY
jgi:hypothetical protein